MKRNSTGLIQKCEVAKVLIRLPAAEGAAPSLRNGSRVQACAANVAHGRAGNSEVPGDASHAPEKEEAAVGHGQRLCERAGDEIRTRDIQLGKLSLYQLSYTRFGIDDVVILNIDSRSDQMVRPRFLLTNYPQLRLTEREFNLTLKGRLQPCLSENGSTR